METIWLFTIACLANCPQGQPQNIKDPTYNAISYVGCDQQAKAYIVKYGIAGQLHIFCRPYQRSVVQR